MRIGWPWRGRLILVVFGRDWGGPDSPESRDGRERGRGERRGVLVDLRHGLGQVAALGVTRFFTVTPVAVRPFGGSVRRRRVLWRWLMVSGPLLRGLIGGAVRVSGRLG